MIATMGTHVHYEGSDAYNATDEVSIASDGGIVLLAGWRPSAEGKPTEGGGGRLRSR